MIKMIKDSKNSSIQIKQLTHNKVFNIYIGTYIGYQCAHAFVKGTIQAFDIVTVEKGVLKKA